VPALVSSTAVPSISWRLPICILRLNLRTAPPPSRVMRFATLSTRQPAIGETLCALGFVVSAETFEQDEVEVLKMAAKLRLTSGP
jgi:hypothetical protein